MNVLIVAKTRMRTAACVGGLTLDDRRNVRLLLSTGANQPTDTPYEVGEIWDLTFRPKRRIVAPHIEDVEVAAGQRLGRQADLQDFLLARIHPWQGGPEQLFDGLLCFTGHGAGYISHAIGLPRASVGFWLPAADLWNDDHEGKAHYRYASPNGTVSIAYVGYAPPVKLLPRGSLLRVSLARWWQPEDATEPEKRCYLQLSGWFDLRPTESAVPAPDARARPGAALRGEATPSWPAVTLPRRGNPPEPRVAQRTLGNKTSQ